MSETEEKQASSTSLARWGLLIDTIVPSPSLLFYKPGSILREAAGNEAIVYRQVAVWTVSLLSLLSLLALVGKIVD